LKKDAPNKEQTRRVLIPCAKKKNNKEKEKKRLLVAKVFKLNGIARKD